MSMFGKILEKLGVKQTEPPKKAGAQTLQPPPAPPRAGEPVPPASKGWFPFPTPAPKAVPVVDVMAKLEELAAANPQKLNWETSIVDLLKLLNIDSSYDARKELATELNCPPEKMQDSAQMNMWLHKTILQKIAENGGNIPKDLLG